MTTNDAGDLELCSIMLHAYINKPVFWDPICKDLCINWYKNSATLLNQNSWLYFDPAQSSKLLQQSYNTEYDAATTDTEVSTLRGAINRKKRDIVPLGGKGFGWTHFFSEISWGGCGIPWKWDKIPLSIFLFLFDASPYTWSWKS